MADIDQWRDLTLQLLFERHGFGVHVMIYNCWCTFHQIPNNICFKSQFSTAYEDKSWVKCQLFEVVMVIIMIIPKYHITLRSQWHTVRRFCALGMWWKKIWQQLRDVFTHLLQYYAGHIHLLLPTFIPLISHKRCPLLSLISCFNLLPSAVHYSWASRWISGILQNQILHVSTVSHLCWRVDAASVSLWGLRVTWCVWFTAG